MPESQPEQSRTVILVEDDIPQEQDHTLDSQIPPLRHIRPRDDRHQRNEQLIRDTASAKSPSKKRQRNEAAVNSDDKDLRSASDRLRDTLGRQIKRREQQFRAKDAQREKSFLEEKELLQRRISRLEADIIQLNEQLRVSTLTNESIQRELDTAHGSRLLECSICFEQPDEWITLSCGHMFCARCRSLQILKSPEQGCALCKAPVTGCIRSCPFAG
ncbi:hypothetical protein BGW36DRAFT_431186 [Talaromyces proteolyticus]|uniref:RING-type domain-containing protein n=1 Tax=Talaromyces proteolyticus TaxID=1131652 RepID=A0AAD4KIK8_9EURO|nr:uncharacterized protein BGW36DRAFT_431186 [Talaromyces proteolyticus]KAH8691944.1 hypothetical protein BGW36DRAFT_431186 [Talaromyces proteolyticus]